MSLKTFPAIISVFSIAYCVSFVLAPRMLGAIRRTVDSPTSELIALFFGVALPPFGMILWFARRLDRPALRNVLDAVASGATAGTGVAAIGNVTEIMNAMGWTAALIYAFGTLGALWFLKGN